ncbi:MAG: tetratricopeptide repeat protein [Gemmatimonadota bacterium]
MQDSRPFLRMLALFLITVSVTAGNLPAQQDQLTRAFDLERRGNYTDAATAYRTVLQAQAADAGALLGLERALTALNKLPDIIPQVQAALAAKPTSSAIYGVALRTWATLERPDSAHHVLDLWVEVQPNDEAPYREWANLALTRRDRPEARRTYQLARERLKRNDALAAEVAQLATLDQDYPTAAREWALAVRRLPGYRALSVNTLSGVAESDRQVVLAELAKEGSVEARQIAATLMARWENPVKGFQMLSGALPGNNPQAIEILRQFQDALQPLATSDARRALGMSLEAMAMRTSGAQASRYRVDAARTYAEAGDSESARRMLGSLAADPGSPRGVAADAGGTLVSVLLDEGKVEDAARELGQHSSSIPPEQLQQLRRRVALGWARAGNLDRADSVIAGDSTVEGLDLAGRLKLYRGDLVGASTLLRSAGPFAGSREEATSRTAILALLQPIQEDSLPELGAALLDLERRDTTKAITGLARLASRLPAAAGGAELRLQVGRLQLALGQKDLAEQSFRAAAGTGAEATMPAALFDLARLLAANGKGVEGQAILEQLILEHPQSAVIPQARRLLDELHGAVPRT